MSFFKKMLASVGVGAAKVNTELHTTEVMPGGILSGVVYIEGGDVEQQVDRIYLSIKTHYIRESNDRKIQETAVVAKYLLTDGFTLQPGDKLEKSFQFDLPHNLPITLHRADVWVETGLDISSAVDPSDRDRLHVVPSREMQIVLDAIDLLGFKLREVTNDYAPKLGGNLPFVQEFEYVPTSRFRGYLDELEVLFYPMDDSLELLLQIDRRARGLSGMLSEAMGTDETYVRLHLYERHLERGAHSVAQGLEEIISKHL
ncbi:sporulation protein [Paenibacillus silvae]|uniref:sporulation protein n=1 Tax=Paenibacillus silvae TaxID=1325358 RepID=UPI0011A95AE6|nr:MULTISPECIES: sporulation protein [Paenibacillus]MCK6074575.1 sporulation protein [Paenibacillus silvae]MCK6147949.1 sporulation protein [Paenibacillus silvae]MCK6266247.1 sporulation protein [Paenibacillus silvae]